MGMYGQTDRKSGPSTWPAFDKSTQVKIMKNYPAYKDLKCHIWKKKLMTFKEKRMSTEILEA